MIEKVKSEINESSLDATSTNLLIRETTIKQRSETPKTYLDFNCIEIKKSDIERIHNEYKVCCNSHQILFEILTNVFLGISTTLLGVIISGIFNLYNDLQWQFWFSYVVCPILCMGFLFAYILMLLLKKNRKDQLLKVIKEKLLEPTGYMEGRNND